MGSLLRKTVRAVLPVIWLSLASTASATPFTFSVLPPGGAISGAPGATIGWGYVVTNDSATDWLSLTGVDADPFAFAFPDASPFDFPILAPLQTLTVPYDPTLPRGLFQITWDVTAGAGSANAGTFTLHGEFFDGDPLAGGSFLAAADDQAAAYSASVVLETAEVPEPATLLLCVTGLAVASVRRRRARG